MEIKEMRKLLGVSQVNFSKKYEIPLRTLQHWEAGDRECPAYVLKLLERAVSKRTVEKESGSENVSIENAHNCTTTLVCKRKKNKPSTS